mmetsp:Transcript_41275/g.109281  ORF Transcript_41275/g.109281 Transcript_41275/m.109281 type:complete len:93 (+) Transcript_41275:14-292(+)
MCGGSSRQLERTVPDASPCSRCVADGKHERTSTRCLTLYGDEQVKHREGSLDENAQKNEPTTHLERVNVRCNQMQIQVATSTHRAMPKSGTD